jgi:hypothetical protein
MKATLYSIPILLCLSIFALPVFSQTEVRHDITENTTWTKSESPYILIGSPVVAQGVTLTIKPGVVVKFFSFSSTFTIHGQLVADGSPSYLVFPDPIIFTSYKDDLHGGDTNENGDADAPASGDWTSIILADTASAFFRSCEFRYGGYWGYPMLDLRAPIDTIRYCRFSDSHSPAIHSTGGSLQVTGSSFHTGNGIEFLYGRNDPRKPNELILRHNEFKVENAMVEAGYGDSLTIFLEGNTVVHSSTTYKANACYVHGSFTGENFFTSQPDIPFVFSLLVEEGSSLTLPPGTVVKIIENEGIQFRGSLWALGTKEKPIVFTSIYDDSFGGDTNGDGNATAPERGVWGPLIFSGTTDSSRLEKVLIKYTGQWDPAIQITNSHVLFKECVVAECGSDAFQINGASPEITGSTISHNLLGFDVGFTGSPVIHHNDIMLNNPEIGTGGGVKVQSLNPETTVAENNYWGSATGPKHYTYHPEGTGDLVIGPVDYEPFEREIINDGLISKPVLNIGKEENTIHCRETSAFDFSDVLWEFGDGSTSAEFTADHSYAALGIYEVCYTATSDYGVKVRQCQMVDLSTSVPDLANAENHWSVYPNPAGPMAYCRLTVDQPTTIILELFDMTGTQVLHLYSNKIGKGNHTIPLVFEGIPGGIYTLRGTVGNTMNRQKIMIHSHCL